MRISRRMLSYVLVAIIAFGTGNATRASADEGGLPALWRAVHDLGSGLAKESARAMSAEAATDLAIAAVNAQIKANDVHDAEDQKANEAALQRERAERLIAEAKLAEQLAAALERPLDPVRATGADCRTGDGRPGHVAVTVESKPPYTITFTCVPNAQ